MSDLPDTSQPALPVNLDDVDMPAPVGRPLGGAVNFSDLAFALDHHKGEWTFAGGTIGKRVRVVFVTNRSRRLLFSKDYNQLGPDEKSVVVCQSYDGYEAFGLGRRPDVHELEKGDDGEPLWTTQLAPRQCINDAGEEVCPSAMWHEGFCLCPMRYRLLGGLLGGKKCTPFFWNVHGTLVKPVGELLREVNKTALRQGTKPFLIACELEVIEPRSKRGRGVSKEIYPVRIGAATKDEAEGVVAWARSKGPLAPKALWQQDVDAEKESMRRIGESEGKEGDGGQEGTQVDDGIPF